jgi:pyruvyltransferase
VTSSLSLEQFSARDVPWPQLQFAVDRLIAQAPRSSPLEIISGHSYRPLIATAQGRRMSSCRTIPAMWFNDVPNWGDALNPFLIEHISGKKAIRVERENPTCEPKHIVIGSIVQWADAQTIVWGSGLIAPDCRLAAQPKAVHAVRGPLTRQALLDQGIECPEVYGDPALLYPHFYNPRVRKKYRLGIVPHYVDRDDLWLARLDANPDVLVIDLAGDVHGVIRNIKACDVIASSSLHGLIAADAYGIPSTWIKFSDKVHGNGFKFKDYFLSVQRRVEEPLVISPETTLHQIFDRFHTYRVDIDLEGLHRACPFRDSKGLSRVARGVCRSLRSFCDRFTARYDHPASTSFAPRSRSVEKTGDEP